VAVHSDGLPRISKIGTRVATDEVLITACYHCEIPECMLSCNYGAIRRDAQGRIRFETDNCVGCAACVDACPYKVIRLVKPFAVEPQSKASASWLEKLPLLGRWFTAACAPEAPGTQRKAVVDFDGQTTPVSGNTVKCDLCAGLPFEACVYNCPTSAIERREPQSLFEPGRRGAPR